MNDEPSSTAAAPVAEGNTASDKNNNNIGDEMNGVAVVGQVGESSAQDQQKEQLQHQAQSNSESATAAASAASSETTANGNNDKKRKDIDPSEEELEQKQKQSNAKPNPKKKSKNPLLLSIRRELQQCCKVNDLKKAMQLYEDTKTKGIYIEAQTCYNLLCDGLGERPVRIGTPYKRMSNNKNNGTTAAPTPTPSNGAGKQG